MASGKSKNSLKRRERREAMRKFFREKRREITSVSHQALATHAVLRGSHREQILRDFLEDILPSRYEIGQGMVYDSLGHASKEAEIVIWDALNYPRLPARGHVLFFAESVHCVLDVKSIWSSDEMEDIFRKTRAIRELLPYPAPSLEDRLAIIEQDIRSIKTGVPHSGFLLIKHKIAFAAIFLSGGASVDIGTVEVYTDRLDDDWPEIILMLEPGIVILKDIYEDAAKIEGVIKLVRANEDALLIFSLYLLDILGERVLEYESPMYPWTYASETEDLPIETTTYKLTNFPPTRIPLWGD